MVESPLGYAYVEISDPGAFRLLGNLYEPVTLAQLQEKNKDIQGDKVAGLLMLLLDMKALSAVNEAGFPVEDDDSVLQQWEFHDLYFHSRSRMGRHNQPSGATYPFIGKIEPSPVLKPLPQGEVIPLYKPDIDSLIKEDVPFTRVVETKKTILDSHLFLCNYAASESYSAVNRLYCKSGLAYLACRNPNHLHDAYPARNYIDALFCSSALFSRAAEQFQAFVPAGDGREAPCAG